MLQNKIISHASKVKTFKLSLNLSSNHSPCHILRFTSQALTSLIMPAGITGKSGPEYRLIRAGVNMYIFASSGHIIIQGMIFCDKGLLIIIHYLLL